jgi:hypothetical protein
MGMYGYVIALLMEAEQIFYSVFTKQRQQQQQL